MATDFMYNSARSKFAIKQINWTTAAIKAMLVSSTYSPLATHEFVSDVNGGAIVVRSELLTSLAEEAGVCRGEIPQFEALLAAQEVVGCILYIDTGNDATSSLLYYSSTGPGFPFTPAGFTYAVLFDQANGGFFQV